MLSSVLVIVPFLAGIHAANDWNTPCVSGQCSYDLPQTNGASASGSMQIWGSEDAITDVTPAAGWQILGCDPAALSQNLRLVCMDEDDPTSLCGHLYQNTGAVNKVVRLPENCGASPFARVANAWTPTDQTIPATVKARLARRGAATPTVKALAIDTNWDSIDWSQTGKVNLAINAGNAPGAAAPLVTPAPRSRSRRAARRGFFGGLKSKAKGVLGDITSVAGDVGGDITSVAGDVGGDITSIAGDVTSAVGAGASKVETAIAAATSAVGDLTAVNKTKTFSIKPVAFSKSANLFNTSLACGPVTGAISVDVAASANVQPALTFTILGTIVPPDFTTFKVGAGLSGSASGTVTVKADITGQIDSGKIPLFSAGVPGLDIPGVITVGPIFEVDAQFVGELELEMDLTVGVNLQLNNAQLTFPPDDSASPDASAFSLGDTPLTLSASPSVQATGTLTAHLIPSLSLGIKAIDGKVDATIFINLDTSAALVLSLDASAQVSKTVAGATATATAASDDDNSTTTALVNATTTADASTDTDAVNSTSTSAAIDAAPTANSTDVALAERDTSTAFGGCVQVNGNIAINAGATGDFFGLFDKDTSVSLFTKGFQIFKKCFGNGATAAPTRRRMRRVAARQLQARAFTCPVPGLSAPAPVTSGTVSSSSISPA
ncbi:hypothetical protein B0H16DRAFT_273726 [Mycena metata]|uniref:DUF7223 domain-containing protein n=1 Tax=Mycena metata TaxID=1033252 RepID=A0AAD7NNZ6_9AGAR|nr:hypothetical protein B0H16DRAFT_273726 [Mycena metata]